MTSADLMRERVAGWIEAARKSVPKYSFIAQTYLEEFWAETWDRVKDELKRLPTFESITELLRFLWPNFARMSSEAQDEWVAGMLIRHLQSREDRECAPLRRKAAVSCAAAVEIELREKLFKAFKQRVSTRPQIRKNASDSSDKVFPAFLLDERVITLGEMGAILKRRSNSREPIFKDLQIFVAEQRPSLRGQEETIEKIASFRNPAVHSSTDVFNPDDAISMCRALLDILALRNV